MAWDNDFDNRWPGNRSDRDVWGVGNYGAQGDFGYGPGNYGAGYGGGNYGGGNYGAGYFGAGGGPGYYGGGYGGNVGQGYGGYGGYSGYGTSGQRNWGQGNWEQGNWGQGNFGQGNFAQGGYGQGTYRQGSFAGRGPRNYHRSDQRIEEDINDRLTSHPGLDASDVQVRVDNGEVTLTGNVDSRWAKREAEDIADSVSGVKDVHNQLSTSRSMGDREVQRASGRESRSGSESGSEGRSRGRSSGATART